MRRGIIGAVGRGDNEAASGVREKPPFEAVSVRLDESFMRLQLMSENIAVTRAGEPDSEKAAFALR